MKSTGEVMGIDSNFNLAFAKAQLGAGDRLPTTGRLFVSVKDSDKPRIVGAVRQLTDWGLQVIATGGPAAELAGAGTPRQRAHKNTKSVRVGKCGSVRVDLSRSCKLSTRTTKAYDSKTGQ